jgi:predicted RNA-binding Zn ribbon-like protein
MVTRAPKAGGGIVLAVGPDQTPHEWGGRACLALVNSVLWRRSGDPQDVLTEYPKLINLVGQSGGLPDQAGLLARAATDPERAEVALGRATGVREVLYRVFSAVAAQRQVEESDRHTLNRAINEAAPHVVLDERLRPSWDDPMAWDLPCWQAVMSAADLLGAGDLTRLKQCPGERCGWVFVDDSRNRSRRWCEPNQCGNRERVRAHYRRTRVG